MNGELYVIEFEEKRWQRHDSVMGVFCGESERQLRKHERSDAIVSGFSTGSCSVTLKYVSVSDVHTPLWMDRKSNQTTSIMSMPNFLLWRNAVSCLDGNCWQEVPKNTCEKVCSEHEPCSTEFCDLRLGLIFIKLISPLLFLYFI